MVVRQLKKNLICMPFCGLRICGACMLTWNMITVSLIRVSCAEAQNYIKKIVGKPGFLCKAIMQKKYSWLADQI